MPRVWVFNNDDLIPREDPHFRSVFIPKTIEILPRFLLCLRRGDAVALPRSVPDGFFRYACSVKGLDPGRDIVYRIRWRGASRSLIGSMLADKALVARLRELGRRGDWGLEPFVESPNVARLINATGIPTRQSDLRCLMDGTTLKLNDKGFFKSLVRMLGIETVPGYLADDRETLEACIEQVSKENRDRVILRKTRYVGGIGNLVGGREGLRLCLPRWYRTGQVLVEHWLDLEQTVGSLVTVSRGGMRFGGVDVQLFDEGRWAGFCYPHPDPGVTREVRAKSLRFAALLKRMNARGEVNLDWGVVKGARGRRRVVALECNFRHNGFGYIMRFAQDYFGRRAGRLHIRYLENFRLSRGLAGFEGLRRALAGVRLGGEAVLIDRPGLRRGAVITMPPGEGRCALALFGEDDRALDRLEDALREKLG